MKRALHFEWGDHAGTAGRYGAMSTTGKRKQTRRLHTGARPLVHELFLNCSRLLELSLASRSECFENLKRVKAGGRAGHLIAIIVGMTVVGQVAMSPPSSPPSFSTAATAPIATCAYKRRQRRGAIRC